ncbi:MAG: hypothetical protein K9L79_11725 [Methylobacter tundripaludum]|nr:hypothetical protein [Methylobacter tundripaludum]
MRRVLLIAIFLFATSAVGFDRQHWIQVAGGSWEPDDTILTKADAKLKHKFQSHVRYVGPGDRWEDYTFQYQGSKLPTGQKIIAINAFCSNIPEEWLAHFKLTSEWVRIFGGGGCLFRAYYDSTTDKIFDLRVNAPK